jgi:dihydrofolate reductase
MTPPGTLRRSRWQAPPRDESCTRSESELVHPPQEEETMGKLIVTEQVTLDWVAQGPGGPDDDREGGFTHGGWQAPLMGQEAHNIFEQAKNMDALLLGRRTYEIFANYWPTAPDEIPFKSLLNGVPKYVVSRTLAEPLDWRGSTVIGKSIAEDVTVLKERHDELHVIGSINLVQSLLRFDLVDRLELWVYPVLLGSGKQVFGDGTKPTGLRLIESVAYPNGMLQLTYDTAGTPTYGQKGSPKLTSE